MIEIEELVDLKKQIDIQNIQIELLTELVINLLAHTERPEYSLNHLMKKASQLTNSVRFGIHDEYEKRKSSTL
jgi:hypothetical protein